MIISVKSTQKLQISFNKIIIFDSSTLKPVTTIILEKNTYFNLLLNGNLIGAYYHDVDHYSDLILHNVIKITDGINIFMEH